MKPWNGQVFLCGQCGNIFNNRDLECPCCAVKASIEEMVELGVATATMGDGEVVESEVDTEKTRQKK